MAANETNAVAQREQGDDAVSRNVPDADLARYKWMTSILTPARNRGMYLKPLEKITPDAKVPFTRIVIGLAIAGIGAIVGIKVLFDNALRARYILLPVILAMLGVAVLGVLFLLSSRGKSMLSAIFGLNLFKLIERNRSRKNLRFDGVGIEEISDDGVIHFMDGDVGVAYAVRGQLSNSSLPAVADFVDGARAQYLVTRNHTSQEIRLTAIAPNEMRTQIEALDDKIRRNVGIRDERAAWRANMANVQREYLTQLVRGGQQLTLNQTVILRDVDMGELQRTMRAFENMARGAMYERCNLLTNKNAVVERLAGPALMSRAGKKAA